MDTRKNTPSGNPRKRPAARPADDRRKAPQKKTASRGSDRARREAAARAAKIKNMKEQVQNKPRRSVSRPHRPAKPVVYTQPKVFNRNRLLVQLLSMAAAVLAVIMCLSIFFRVETITVTGANAYSAWRVREASGIQEGDYLMTFSKARACAKIKAELPYVDWVRIGIKLPNTVNIVIEEIDVVYAVQDSDGIWWLITSDGLVMEQADDTRANDFTKVLGVKLSQPQPETRAVAYQELISDAANTETTPEGDPVGPVPLIVTEQQKLTAALEILQALELNEIVGEAASVDVTDLSRIELWYGTRYQVNLGDTNNMDYKIASMKAAIASFNEYEMAMLDCSFTTWPDKVAYTPFE